MKRVCTNVCVLYISLSLIACAGVTSNANTQKEIQEEISSGENVEYVVETTEVFFANSLDRRYELDVVPTTNSCYGYGKQEGTEELFAYVVASESSYTTENVVNIMRGLGLMVLEDYPYCYYNTKESNYVNDLLLGECVVVGTYDEIHNLFDGTEPIGGVLWTLYPAPRPDIVDYIKKYSNEQDLYEAYESCQAMIKAEIGDSDKVKTKVSVILSEE